MTIDFRYFEQQQKWLMARASRWVRQGNRMNAIVVDHAK